MPTVNEKIGQYGKELIDYEAIVKNYPWIIHEKMNCILSPDSDGLLCGLLMGHVFDWSVKGFYDGKILVVAILLQFLRLPSNAFCGKDIGNLSTEAHDGNPRPSTLLRLFVAL
jgi:hypothetical protein